MPIADWLPFISVSIITTVLGFIGGVVFKPLVAQAIAHKFNRDIEDLRSSLRKNEEEFRAALKTRDDEIGALRSTAIGALSARTATLDKRKLEAVEGLWSAVVDRALFKSAAKMTGSIKFEVAIDAAAKQDNEGQELRAFADVIWKTLKLDDVRPPATSPDKERPFVSPMAWARFSTYRQMVSFPVAQLAAMRSGVGSNLLADPKPLLDAIKAALPHFSDFIDQYGSTAIPNLVEDMEAEVLKEIMASLDENSAHEKQIEQAAQILSAVKRYSEALETKPTPPAAGIVVVKQANT